MLMLSACLLTTVSAVGQFSRNLDFVTIGDPGNRATIPSEVPMDPTLSVGAVGYEYRMMRSKLDVETYIDFVRAYAPHWSGGPADWTLTGPFVVPFQKPGGGWDYQPRPGYEGSAARLEWQMAARYCNWLHNDRRPEAEAFERGAYDTSTFNFTPFAWTAQLEPSPGAKYWIPSRDEWVKAAHYDPDRYGPGQGGYWLQPNSSDQPLIMGYPSQGGETIGDLHHQNNPSLGLGAWPLGQYPHVQSPWGLVDISATVPDYTSFVTSYSNAALAMGGSMAGSAPYFVFDRLDFFAGGAVWGDNLGAIRVATSVPVPATSVCALAGTWALRRRRR